MNVVYSYIPLLEDPLTINYVDESQCDKLIAEHPDSLGEYCCWTMEDDIPVAIISYPNAEQIYNHLMRYCRNNPTEYFDLEYVASSRGYAVGLVPNVQHTINMMNKLRMMGGKIPLCEDIKLIYDPLHFYRDAPSIFNNHIKNELILGLIDSSNVNSDLKDHMIIGKFQISEQNMFVDALMDSMDDSTSPNIYVN